MRRWLFTACIALALWPAAIADGQVRIVVRPSVQPRGEPVPTPEQTPADDVQPIEPTAEEAARIADLIEQLGAARLAQRDRAMAELAGFEARALQQVRGGKEHQEDEIANRCALLEEVIQSRQAELFLAARRLSLQPTELERMLTATDVKPLLEILKSRAQPGLTPLWARVLTMLAVRPQVIPAAQLCISIEGNEGYGRALSEAGRSRALGAEQAAGLLNLLAMLPPGRVADAAEALAFCGNILGGAEGVQQALRASAVLRGLYTAPDALGATRTPDDSRRRLDAEGEGLRQAVALCMTPACAESDLATAGLPALSAMSPLVLAEYLSLLRRSGFVARIETSLISLVTEGASARALSAAGAAWADAVSVDRMQGAFASLPGAAQLGALDALWLNPRDPARMQPFLLGLLKGKDDSLRAAAARMLGQYRAASTVEALVDAGLNDPKAAQFALESLAPMADLLSAARVKQLLGRLPTADLSLRSALIDALVQSRNAEAAKSLIEGWKSHLPRNELMSACQLISADTSNPAGALAAAILTTAEGPAGRARYFATLDYQMLVLMRALLAGPDAKGFELLARLSRDEASQSRMWAAAALALANQDATHVDDWIRRLVGETPDANPYVLSMGVALSITQQAEDFRRRTLQQGASSPHLQVVLQAVQHGRSKGVTRDELLRVLFDTPANAREWAFVDGAMDGPMPPEAMKTLITTLLFSEEFQPLGDPASALLLAESGIDVLQLLYGDDAAAKPLDVQRTLVTALIGEPERARKVIGNAEDAQDGSNFYALQLARAWLGMLAPEESHRILRHAADNLPIRVLLLHKSARLGDAHSLRGLLDRVSSQAGRFTQGATAGVEISTDRWRGTEVELDGVAGAALGLNNGTRGVTAWRLQRFFGEKLPAEWDAWWSCRRGLLEFDATSGKYRILELP